LHHKTANNYLTQLTGMSVPCETSNLQHSKCVYTPWDRHTHGGHPY